MFSSNERAFRLLQAISALSDDAIMARDLDDKVVFWSRGAEQMYGFTSAEMIGQPFTRIIPADRLGEYHDLMRRAVDGERVGPFETERLTRSGHRLYVTVALEPVRDPDGRTIAALVTTRDASTRRRMEQALGRSEARWRAVVESAVDGIIVIDRHGRIESFNGAAERLFGYCENELVGRNVAVLMPEPTASEHDEYLRHYLETGEARIMGVGRDVQAKRKNGTVFPVHLSVGKFTLDGETKFTGIVRDLTERVNLERRLREESSLVRIGELAAVLAHEVKNPLAAVSGAIQMLKEHLPEPADQEIVGEILRRLDGLGALMTDLLVYARPPRPKLSEVNLSGLVRALISLFRSDPSWHELEADIDGDAAIVIGDPELLKMVFQNLLLNAAQAMHGRGTLRVLLRRQDKTLVVDVIDTGPGVPPEVRDRLFTPFVTTKARGTGLGLATVRRIVESHGGQVSVVSTGAEGTVVRVVLPDGPSPQALA